MKKILITSAILGSLTSAAFALPTLSEVTSRSVRYLAPEDGSYDAGIVPGEGAIFVEYKDVSADFGGSSAKELVIDGDATLTADTQWILPQIVFVINGTLTIEPGTIIRGEQVTSGNFDPGALVITRGAQISANGTPSNPIVFTTAALNQGATINPALDGIPDTTTKYDQTIHDATDFLDIDPFNSPLGLGLNFSTTAGNSDHMATVDYFGLWGGLIINGNAPTNVGTIPAADTLSVGYGTNNIEGLDPTVVGDLGVYGGQLPNDNSGVLRYVSVRHGGANLAADNEINGITFGGVGFGTTVEFVEVYCNADDAFEWFGGTVNTRYLISLFNNDDSFDIDEGFTGLGQFWFSMMIDDGVNGDRAAEHDGRTTGVRSNGYFGLPEAFCTVYNATYIGGGADGRISEQAVPVPSGSNQGIKGEMFQLRDDWGGAYFNSIFVDAPYWAINIADDGDERFDAGDYVFRSNIWYNFNMAKTTATSHDFGKGVVSSPIGVSNTTTEIAGPGTSEKGFEDRQDSNYYRALAILEGTTEIDVDGGGVDISLPTGYFDNNDIIDPFAIRRLISTFDRRAGLDPRPQSSVAQVTSNLEPYTGTFFQTKTYKGAFPTSGALWTSGWSAANKAGYLKN